MKIGNNVDLTNDTQKIIAAGLAILCIAILWWALPSLIWFFEHTLYLIALVVGTLFLFLMRNNIWDGMKQISWATTKTMISKNPLWYMYRYHDPYLLNKIQGMENVLVRIMAAQKKQTARGIELQNNIETNSKMALKAEGSAGNENVIRSLRNKVNIDTQQLTALTPKILNTQNQIAFIKELVEIWKADAEDLKYSLDATASSYELNKELSAASGAAKAFLGDDSQEYKAYKESVKQIENSMALYTANFENFERQAKPILDNLAMARSVSEDAGALLIEQFKQGTVSLRVQQAA